MVSSIRWKPGNARACNDYSMIDHDSRTNIKTSFHGRCPTQTTIVRAVTRRTEIWSEMSGPRLRYPWCLWSTSFHLRCDHTFRCDTAASATFSQTFSDGSPWYLGGLQDLLDVNYFKIWEYKKKLMDYEIINESWKDLHPGQTVMPGKLYHSDEI